MIKTGICSIEALKNLVKNKSFGFHKQKKASINLYEDACGEKDSEELTEWILRDFLDERGAYKRTYINRFDVFDGEVVGILKEHFKEGHLKIHDVGVSDGRTSVNLFHKLSQIYSTVYFTASDYNPRLKILQKDTLKITLSDSNALLEIFYPPFVFNVIKRDSFRHYPLNHLIRKAIEFLKVRPLLRSYEQKKVEPKEIWLFSPSAISLAKSQPEFKLAQHNVLKPLDETYDVIRAMNVLNPPYFKEQDFPEIIQNFYNALPIGGIFITGSNEDAGTLVNGGIYQKTSDGFEEILRSGEGSPVQSHITQKF